MKRRGTAEKIAIFRKLFTGLPDAYGTYDPVSGRARQVKAPVTDRVILDHLSGHKPYGVYLLVKDRTRAIAVDFDSDNRLTVSEFVGRAKHYDIPAYIERSKSKGYHAWIFFQEEGVPARKARLVMHHLLNEIEKPEMEIFPKQDSLDTNTQYGNFINAPLFGTLVRQGKTVFVDLMSFNPYPEQWDFLESVNKVKESDLDTIIEMNDLPAAPTPTELGYNPRKNSSWHALPICARKMLRDGVRENQRDSCFRLAVHFKRLGLPYDMAVAALRVWVLKNQPIHGKGILQDGEIVSQTRRVYNKSYTSYGCGTSAIIPFCEPSCPVNQWRKEREILAQENVSEGLPVGNGQGGRNSWPSGAHGVRTPPRGLK